MALALPTFHVTPPHHDWRLHHPLSAQPDVSAASPREVWYDKVEIGGLSPYDFAPRTLRQGESKIKLLFLLDYKDYLERMNSHSYEIVDAALRHPRATIDVWGKGWDGWKDDLPVSVNLANRILPGTTLPVGCGFYDAYWSFSNYPNPHDPLTDYAGCGSVHVHQLGDCHSDECIGGVFAQTGNITATKYAFEMLDMFQHERLAAKHPGSSMQLFTHSPDAANPWDYYPVPRWSDKTHGAVLFGATHALYTIRPRIEHAIQHNKTFITQFRHPGFDIVRNKVPKRRLATYVPGHPSYKPQMTKRSEFAEGMRRAQICIFDSSVEKKAIRKYAQAFLSGCVVAADLPTEQEEAFRNFVIVLRPNAPIAEINDIIYQALLDPHELQMKALAAFAYAREHLTNLRKVDRMLDDIQAYRAGARGYSFSSPLSLSCRKYHKLTVPWCQGDMKANYPALAPRGLA